MRLEFGLYFLVVLALSICLRGLRANSAIIISLRDLAYSTQSVRARPTTTPVECDHLKGSRVISIEKHLHSLVSYKYVCCVNYIYT
ncbi:hypothetical protein BDW74DRAFT_114959 [Aspergillus multicolor]|uniref:uncharacterized protein n=1 Tax=Aspergillus multicolor TaxID=41759 RepID=UPI003CCE185C